mgnify:CR=1 FL=1
MVSINLKKKKMNLSNEQREVITWLLYHHLGTLHETLNSLLREREANIPDKCVAMYDAMTNEKRNEIILILSRYYNDVYKNGNPDLNSVEKIIDRYSYI